MRLQPLLLLGPLAAVIACTDATQVDSASDRPAKALARSTSATLASKLSALRDERPATHLARSTSARAPASQATAAKAADAGGATQPPAVCKQKNGPVPARYKAIVETFEQELTTNGPGAAMAILEHGHLAFAYGAGTKGPNSTEPVCPSSLFRIGSMTKALTATAYLQAVGHGRAALDETLQSIAPDVTLPAGSEFSALTMGELLEQASGVSEVTDVAPTTGPSNEAYLSTFLTSQDFANDVYFMYPPGALWFYSNTNFMLAGLAVERTTGMTYREAVRHVTDPLGMSRTTFLPELVMRDGDYTNGSSLQQPNADGSPGDLTPLSSAVNAAVEPAGGAFSSVLDFAKYMEFIAQGNGAVLPRPLWQKQRSGQIKTRQEGAIDSYGYGLYAGSGLGIVGPGTDAAPYFPVAYIGHGGSQAGWLSDWFLFPDSGFGILFLANSDSGFFSNTMTQAIEQLAGVQPTALPAADAVAPSLFPSYVGDYNDPENLGRVNITDVNGTVTISMPDLDAAGYPYDRTLAPLDRNSFALSIVGSEVLVTFIRGTDGKFDWFRADHLSVAERVPAGDAGAP